MENTCENCKYWKDKESYSYSKVNVNKCAKIKMFWACVEWSEESELIKKDSDTKAFVQDGSDYFAELLTLKDFGCNQFEKK